MKKNVLTLKHTATHLLLCLLCVLLHTSVFGQNGNWNFYFGSSERTSLVDNLKTNSLTYSSSTTSTSIGTIVGGVRPQLGRGDIVIDGDLTIAYASSSTTTTLTLTSIEDIWINGNITASVGKLNLIFDAPAGKKILINGDINTNGGSITVNNGTAVHFQKISGTQTINTAGGAMSFGNSSLRLLNTGGLLVFNSGAGAISMGTSGSIAQESTFYQSPTRLLEWGGIHSNGSSVTEKSYNINVVSGYTYSARLYYWDSWDGEKGEMFLKDANNNLLCYIFRSRRSYYGGFYETNTLSGTYQSINYGLSTAANYGQLSSYVDLYADVSFSANYSGSLRTWNDLDQGVGDESIELSNVWQTTFGTSAYNSGARSIEFITTNTTQDACWIAGFISGGLSLKKSGAGTLKLSNYNTYTGGTTVDAGILQLHDSGVNGNAGKGTINGVLTVNQNATVQLTGSPAALGWWSAPNYADNRVTTLNINGGLVEAVGGQQHIWNMTNGVNFNGGGTIRTNSGTSSASATSYIEWSLTNISVTNATSPAVISGRINLRNDNNSYQLICNVADGSTDNDLLISAAITQSASTDLVKNGTGKLTLSGTNSYAGTSTISAGTLQLGDNSTTGSFGLGAVTNNGAIIVNRSNDLSITNVISGTGGTLTKQNTNVLTLTQNNTYTGITTISAGSLQLGDNSTTGTFGSGAVTNNGVIIVNRSNDLSITNAISGTGTLTKQNTNVLTLTQNNTYTGITTISAGTLQLGDNSTTGTFGSGAVTNNGVIIVNRSNDLSITNAISGTGTLTKQNTNVLTLTQNNTYSGNNTISSGTLVLQNDAPNPTNKTFNGTGQLRIEPASASTSFSSAFSTTGWTFNSTLTGLTIGKANNTANVTNTLNQTINGPISVFGGTITVSDNLISSSANQAVALRASGNVDVAASKTIQTNGGNIILWADSEANGSGGIRIDDNVTLDSRTAADRTAITHTTGGGKIILAGGLDDGGTASGTNTLLTGLTASDGIPDGYAVNSGSAATQTGIALGTSTTGNGHNSAVKIYSGSGEIKLHGSVTNNTSSIGNGPTSLLFYEGYTINGGTSGNITILGSANLTSGNWAMGMDLAAWRTSTASANSTITTANGNIKIIGRASGGSAGNMAIAIDGDANRHIFTATGTGTISLDGLATGTSPTDIRLTNVDLLAASGAINITTSGTSGISIGGYSIGNGLFLGKKDGTSVTSSTSNITISANALSTTNKPLSVNSTGQLVLEPYATSFTSAVTWPITNFSVTGITGLTLGKTNNATNITIGTATSVNGPITLHGVDLTLSAGLTTTNTSTGNITFNGTKLLGSGAIALATGRALTANLSGDGEFTGDISGTTISFTKTGAGVLTLNPTSTLTFSAATVSTGGLTIAAAKQLSVTGTLTNNATFTLKDGATFVQGTSGTSITGTGTFNVEKALAGNGTTWSNTSGRFWYMGVPMVSVLRSAYGNYVSGSNHVWSYSEANKQYTDIITDAALSAGTGYVHRRKTDGTLTFSANGTNGLYRSDFTASGLTKTAGNTAGVHLISNPYMAYLDWEAVYAASSNIDATFYTRTNSITSNNISAIISYNATTNLETNNSGISATAAQLSYIAPMQSIWVRVLGNAGATGTVNMTRSMLSHQSGNVGLKSSTIFPTLARVNLVDGNNFDQLLVYFNSDMSNEVDEYDSEKMAASGTVQIYTMSSNKKLVMNGLRNNKKKVSVPLYLELPETKSYTLQLSEFQLEDGLILLEDKQEGTIQDFTINENYTFFANSGLLQNRFVLHFILPNAELATQGPSNSWVEEESTINEGGSIFVTSNDRGKVTIQQDIETATSGKGSVVVRDVAGKEVYNGTVEGAQTNIQIDAPSGVYFVEVQLNGQVEMKKIFVQN